MATPTADPPFLRIQRGQTLYRVVKERVQDYRDVAAPRPIAASREQASRCMDCGIPFCHWTCPLGNYVPDWNRHLANGEWQTAFFALQATNNLPEVTARICPAMCESACRRKDLDDPLSIRNLKRIAADNDTGLWREQIGRASCRERV